LVDESGKDEVILLVSALSVLW